MLGYVLPSSCLLADPLSTVHFAEFYRGIFIVIINRFVCFFQHNNVGFCVCYAFHGLHARLKLSYICYMHLISPTSAYRKWPQTNTRTNRPSESARNSGDHICKNAFCCQISVGAKNNCQCSMIDR